MSKILSGQPSEVQWSGESSHSTITSANQEVPRNAVAAKLSNPENGTRSPLSSLTSRVVNANHQSVAPSQLESLFAGSRIGSISNCTIQVFQGHPQSMVPNLVPRIVSEHLFQSSSQMTSLAQGVVFVEVFETADIRFRMSNTLLVIAISPFRFLNG